MSSVSTPRRTSHTRQNHPPSAGHHETTWDRVTTVLACTAAFSIVMVALVGPPAVAVFIGSGGLLALVRWRRNFLLVGKSWYLLGFPVLAMISTAWSDAPQLTMRAGLELLITIILSIIISGNLSPQRLVIVLWLGFLSICLTLVPSLGESLSTGLPLSSPYLGSKNQVGRDALLLFAFSLAICLDRRQPIAVRIISVLLLVPAAAFTYLARSGGGTVSILLEIVLFPLFALLALLSPRARAGVGVAAASLFGVALAMRSTLDEAATRFRVDVLNKNESLTGRTYLWDFADSLWRERPFLGHGYGAFWRHGNLDAEGLWRWAGVADRAGFNFHNVIVETKVDLGSIGLIALAITCAAVTCLCLWKQFRRPTVMGALMLSLQMVFYVRSYVESELIGVFSPLTLIFVAGGVLVLLPGQVVEVHDTRKAFGHRRRQPERIQPLHDLELRLP